MDNDFIIAFDTLYTTNHIQILKAMLGLISAENQPFVAVIIKYLELNYTMQLALHIKSSAHPASHDSAFASKAHTSMPDLSALSDFLQKILPFCTEKEAGIVKQLLSMKDALDSFEQMKPLFAMLSQMDEEANNSMDLLKSILSPSQQQIFEMFNEEMNHEMD